MDSLRDCARSCTTLSGKESSYAPCTKTYYEDLKDCGKLVMGKDGDGEPFPPLQPLHHGDSNCLILNSLSLKTLHHRLRQIVVFSNVFLLNCERNPAIPLMTKFVICPILGCIYNRYTRASSPIYNRYTLLDQLVFTQ